MVGEKQVAELSLRRCQRCGRQLMADPGLFARLLDEQIVCSTDSFCHFSNSAVIPLFVCRGCLETQAEHRASAARGKTK